MLRSLVAIVSGNAAASLLTLLRNLLLARLLPVEDYGIAATFALIMAVVEMASAFGLQQQIVQSKEGDDPRFQAALQGFQLLRGVISALAMVLLAWPLAQFLGIPEVASAYQILAVVPVLNALVHFDIHRMNRQQVFGPLLMTGFVPALVSLLALWPLVWHFGDWRAMLWCVILQAALSALVSHLMAERRWRAVFDPKIYAASVRFGWPLLLNAIFLFFIFQGDKLIVGRELGMEALAIFAMGTTLTLTPSLVFGKSVNNFMLPRLSRAQSEESFRAIAASATEISLVFGAFLVMGISLFGEILVAAVLGAKYAALPPLLVWLGVMQAARSAKTGASVVAVSRAQAENALYANVLRIGLLPVAWWVVASGHGLHALILIAIIGEVLGLAVALWLQNQRQGIAYLPLLPVVFFAALTSGLALYAEAEGGQMVVKAAMVASALMSLLLARSLRKMLPKRNRPRE